MMARPLLILAALLIGGTSAIAQSREGINAPVLRATISISGDIVRIGDVIDNAGAAADIAIYRAPDPGTTGTLPTTQVLAALRAHQVIGVDTRNIREITVTRLARTLERAEIEGQIALALEKRHGLGDAANLAIMFDRDMDPLQLDAKNTGTLAPVAVRFDARSRRFDITFEITGDGVPAARLRFTGTATETVEAAVLTRALDRNDIIKASDITIERRPKAEVGTDAASGTQAVGMQSRRPLRAGHPLRAADLAKPDLVQRDQSVMLIYESAGIYLTIRGKALESGTEGDVVTVLNLQSKRTISGTVTGRGQVSIAVATPRAPAAAISAVEQPVSVASASRSTE